jgi:O-antigen ligase
LSDLVPSQLPLDRVIDGAILSFVIFSVLSITAAQASILVALAAWTCKLLRSADRRQLRLPLLLPMTAFLLASVLASLTAVDPSRSFTELRNVFEPALFFLIVNQVASEHRVTALSRVLIVMGTVMAVYGLSQSVVHGAAFRVHGTMSIYMTFAGLVMMIDTLALAFMLFIPHPRSSYWLVPCLLLLTIALVLTQTRGAWLGLAVGVGFILGLRKKRFLLLLPAAALAIFIFAPPAVKARIRSIGDPQDVTARERLYMWNSGLQIIRDHPWTGVGMHGVSWVYPAYKDPRAIRGYRGHLHNNLIQLTAERGLIGLLCWLWIWVAFYRHTWHIYGRLKSDERNAAALVVGSLAAITAFHVEGLFEFTFGDAEVITLVYFLMALPYLVKASPGVGDAMGHT